MLIPNYLNFGLVETKISPKIESSWKEALKEEFSAEYFKALKLFLLEEKKHYEVYPKGDHIFEAFNRCPFNKTKLVILGQDPYHGPGQAHGLCFSVQKGIRKPPSLLNIFKEIRSEYDYEIPKDGDLSCWADQGILLLNAILTVRKAEAGSHRKRGWEKFTDACIKKLSEKREGLVFLLWGRFAGDKASMIDENKHLILKAAHPSPLSAHNGFFGCNHFKTANEYLKSRNVEPIDWRV